MWKKGGWLWWPEEVLASCLSFGRVSPGWEEVTDVEIVHLCPLLGCIAVCLNMVVAVDGPSSDLFGWLLLLHDGFNGGAGYQGV